MIEDVEHPVAIEYADISESLIRDRIVVGLLDQQTKTALLRENHLTLNSAIAIVKSRESATERISALLDNDCHVNEIHRKRAFKETRIKPQISESRSGNVKKTRNNSTRKTAVLSCIWKALWDM